MSALIDTNVLIYSLDTGNPRKREVAKRLLQQVFEGASTAVVSGQNLAEFYSVIVQKLKDEGSRLKAQRLITDISASDRWRKINYSHFTVSNAVKLQLQADPPFWDALLVATMLENGVYEIITENERDFRAFHRLKVVNPFK